MQPFRNPGQIAFAGNHPEVIKVAVIQPGKRHRSVL
jgi:hypothetical protein